MGFRPCIDIHGGNVKQIVGSSLTGHDAKENFVSEKDAAYYASLYKSYDLKGGHIILLDKAGTDEYDMDLCQAVNAAGIFPGGFQLGGGITCEAIESNYMIRDMLNNGITHLIVTSYAFSDGKINYGNIEKLVSLVGKERLVLDLSCRKKDNRFYVVTDRWQKFTDEVLSVDLLRKLSDYCDEFLVHAVDVEGKINGVETDVVKILAEFAGKRDDKTDPLSEDCKNRITYAGGISSYEDIKLIDNLSGGCLDYTIGSALDIFGGNLSFDIIAKGEPD